MDDKEARNNIVEEPVNTEAVSSDNPADTLKSKIAEKKRARWGKWAIFALFVVATIITAFKYNQGGGQIVPGEESSSGEVTIEIRCDDLVGHSELLNDKSLEKYIPEDGVILKTSCEIKPGETTVFDVTDQACKINDVQIEYSYTPGYGGYYIEGINYLYEFSAGKYSGWLYSIDGEMPSYGADKMKLSGGEKIVWEYTVDYRN